MPHRKELVIKTTKVVSLSLKTDILEYLDKNRGTLSRSAFVSLLVDKSRKKPRQQKEGTSEQ